MCKWIILLTAAAAVPSRRHDGSHSNPAAAAASLENKVNTAKHSSVLCYYNGDRFSPTLIRHLFNNRLIRIMRSAVDVDNDDGLLHVCVWVVVCWLCSCFVAGVSCRCIIQEISVYLLEIEKFSRSQPSLKCIGVQRTNKVDKQTTNSKKKFHEILRNLIITRRVHRKQTKIKSPKVN